MGVKNFLFLPISSSFLSQTLIKGNLFTRKMYSLTFMSQRCSYAAGTNHMLLNSTQMIFKTFSMQITSLPITIFMIICQNSCKLKQRTPGITIYLKCPMIKSCSLKRSQYANILLTPTSLKIKIIENIHQIISNKKKK